MGITLDSLDSSLSSVEIKNAAGQALAIDASGNLSVNAAGGSFAVTATSLDIRALASGTDSVSAVQSGIWNIGSVGSITGAVSIVDGGGSLTVDAVALDTRALAFATDKVDVSGSVISTAEAPYSSWQTSVLSASSTAAQIAATPLASRKRIMIQNLGSKDVFIGETNAVTSTSGFKLPKGSSYEMPMGTATNMWCLTSAGTADLRVSEFAA